MMQYLNKRLLIYLGLLVLLIANRKQLYYLLQRSRQLSLKYMGYDQNGNKIFKEHVPVLQVEPNCGLPYKCPQNSFSVFLSTAPAVDNRPRLCVADKYVIKPQNKYEGRGMNAASISQDTFQVNSVRNFNISLYNHSHEISNWIDQILVGDIIIIFTSDEISALGESSRTLFNKLGSGRVQNLQYRSQWYMITQKGTSGFTVYEKITYSKKQEWGDAIEFHGCIPKKIPKTLLTVDDPLKQNKKKIEFCEDKSQEEYRGFCNEPRFEIIMPALVTNKTLLKNEVYAAPIFLFASSDLEIFISSLDNLIHQAGVDLSLITILYEGNSRDVPDLAKIYGVHSSKTIFANSFEERLKQARRICTDLHPVKKYLIVLDLGVIPSPDFLYFFSQLLPAFEKDNSVSAISSWSCNCYGHSGSLSTVYRVIGLPKYGALITVKSRENEFFEEIFTPDVSRLQGPEACHLPSLDASTRIDRPQDLSKELYYQKLVMIQQLGHVIKEEDLLDSCSNSIIKKDINVVYVQLKDNSLSKILQCLGVLNDKYGEYKGLVRLSVNGKAVMIITSDSLFYKSRPIPTEVVTKGVKI